MRPARSPDSTSQKFNLLHCYLKRIFLWISAGKLWHCCQIHKNMAAHRRWNSTTSGNIGSYWPAMSKSCKFRSKLQKYAIYTVNIRYCHNYARTEQEFKSNVCLLYFLVVVADLYRVAKSQMATNKYLPAVSQHCGYQTLWRLKRHLLLVTHAPATKDF